MSYRTFKHMLGETSLERKCRFIFGGGILLLVTISFSWYGHETEKVVIGQTTQTARRLVNPVLKDIHYQSDSFTNAQFLSVLNQMAAGFNKQEDIGAYESYILNPYKIAKAEATGQKDVKGLIKPRDPFESETLERFLKTSITTKLEPNPKAKSKEFRFPDGSPMEVWRVDSARNEFVYIQAVTYKKDECLRCHHHRLRETVAGTWVPVNDGELACVAVVRLPMLQVDKDINKNRAILISFALVTAILAMFASAVIFRYVIVKPVKHLRDVSDAISAGKLNIRSQIQTGDEFEELSHAFNRMLHNLVAMQQELRAVNHDLDKKVDELAQANLALFEMNRLKSDFLATMSHELRTPLNSIIGFSEVLAGNEQLSERQRRYAANIQSSGKMLLGMINDILDLAKIESGKMEVRSEDFSIRDICEGLTSLIRPMADRKSIDLECRLDDAIPLLRQDPGKIRQILYNLLSNAIKFTPDGGRVVLKAYTEGRNVVLSVSDTGIGIADEDRETIFEKFRQAGHPGQSDGILTREHQGTGLGLSIVRELATLLGGEVRLESEPGRGSTFTVRVPMQLAGNRRFEVNVADHGVDLTKARRVETRVAMSSLGLAATSPAARRILGEPDGVEAHK